MSYNDQNLQCVDCQQAFVFTAGEQEFHASKGFTNKPSRCPSCRSARKATRDGGGGGSYSGGGGFGGGAPRREMHPATCAECNKETQVPFLPSGDRPVYCRDCFSSQSDGGSRGGGGGGSRGGGGGGGRGGSRGGRY